MVVIEFTRFEEHFGSTASRMTSMYSQFVSTACVTAGNPECSVQSGVYSERQENGAAHHSTQWHRTRGRGRVYACVLPAPQHTSPATDIQSDRLGTLARVNTNTVVYPRRIWCCEVLIDTLELDVAHEVGRVLKRLLVV
jgi:hypothetical protein